MSDYKRRNINLDKLSNYVRKTGICTEEAALHLMDEIMFLRADVEQLRVQLAGCGVAAMCNTVQSREQQKCVEGDYGWSQSYQDVVNAVGREIKLREELEAAIIELGQLKQGIWQMKDAEIEQLRVQFAEMERSYTHQLSEMARLSDIVCGEVLAYSNTDLFPENVIDAVSEIMQYVDTVRPGEGGKKTEWCVHIIGPDDVHPCRGEFDALRRANQHNVSFAKLMAGDPSPNDPYCVAVAELV